VLAADAKKAESASEATRLIPRPPSLIGRLAWIHWVAESYYLLFIIIIIIIIFIITKISPLAEQIPKAKSLH